jgi:hypothetical protein
MEGDHPKANPFADNEAEVCARTMDLEILQYSFFLPGCYSGI